MIRKYLGVFVTIVICLGLVSGNIGLTSVQAKSPKSVIKWKEEKQAVNGFGGSGAFNKPADIMKLKEPVRTHILDMIFSKEKGIGISIVRNLLGDGVAASTIEPEPGHFVWDDPDWETKKKDFDQDQIWFMNEAKMRGVTTFLSTVWSPPAWMKTNGSVNGTGNGKLSPEHYQDFAEYLAEYVLGYKKYFNLDISYISVANEPTAAAGYSGCIWTPEDFHVFIRDYLGPIFKERNVPAKIVMPESMNFSEDYAVPSLNDPETAKYIDVVATHAYGIGTNVPELPVSKEKGKTIWQTEYMNQGSGLQTYKNNTIKDGLRYANLIGNMFDVTGISAYFWWWPAAVNGADGSDLIRLATEDGTENVNGLFRVFKRYYAFGNYSRFIRPGFVMIDADKNPTDNVMVTAYKDPASGNFAIVAVNNNKENSKVSFELKDFNKNLNKIVPYRTSSNENLKELEDVKVKDDSFTMDLRGNSVTTFIPKKFKLPALDNLKDVFSTYKAVENDGESQGLQVNKDHLVNVQNGDFIKYKNVNFADGTANGQKPHMLSMSVQVTSLAGGTIEVRLDDPIKGKVVGTMDVPSGNDSESWQTVQTLLDTNSVDGAYGIHDLYLVFKGASKKQLFNVDQFSFGDGIVTPIEVKKTVFDFEDNTNQGWAGRSSSNVVTVSDEQAQSGRYSLKTTNRTSTWHGPAVGVTDKIAPGTKYEISAYVRLLNPPSTPSTVKLTMQQTVDGVTSYVGVASEQVSSTDWVQLKGTYTLNDDASGLSLYVESSNATESYYIDNVVINPLSASAN